MLIRIASALLLVLELVKYSLPSASSRATDREFHAHVFAKLARGEFPEWSRTYACVFALSSALSHRAYDAALSMLHAPSVEYPWKETSTRFLRRIFELALIFGDRAIARRSLTEVISKTSSAIEDRHQMETLLRWRFEGLLAAEAAALDMTGKYFENFPEYDEYFKGSINELQGKTADARIHFERSLALAPPAARDLREALERRIAGLGA